jgi:hypothetical protein
VEMRRVRANGVETVFLLAGAQRRARGGRDPQPIHRKRNKVDRTGPIKTPRARRHARSKLATDMPVLCWHCSRASRKTRATHTFKQRLTMWVACRPALTNMKHEVPSFTDLYLDGKLMTHGLKRLAMLSPAASRGSLAQRIVTRMGEDRLRASGAAESLVSPMWLMGL